MVISSPHHHQSAAYFYGIIYPGHVIENTQPGVVKCLYCIVKISPSCFFMAEYYSVVWTPSILWVSHWSLDIELFSPGATMTLLL